MQVKEVRVVLEVGRSPLGMLKVYPTFPQRCEWILKGFYAVTRGQSVSTS